MEWIIENWLLVLAVVYILVRSGRDLLGVLKPDSIWFGILIEVLRVIEGLMPEIAKPIKEAVAKKMMAMPANQREGLVAACAAVDSGKPMTVIDASKVVR